MLYVTDTHPLVRYLIGELPEKSDKIFASAEIGKSTIYIPTIVLAECLYLVEDGTINLDYDDLLSRIESSRNFIPVSLNFQVMKVLPEIKLKEIHDRIIVASAKILNTKLITKDKEIKKSRIVETVW